MKFLMAGGGTGGHVIPLIAVARELARRGHAVAFIGTRTGMEAKLVPAAGFPIDYIDIGGLKRVGIARTLRTLWQLPLSTARMFAALGRLRPAALFSLGGYAAGPVMLAAAARRVPIVLMEPNAIPGMTNRRMGRLVARALVSFPSTAKHFPPGAAEIAGLPVRPEFFALPPKPREGPLTVLISGGSRGSRTLNRAVRNAWRLLRNAPVPIRLIHQTGREDHAEIARAFGSAGVAGEVIPFIDDMPAAFARADLVVCRSGAGAVAELAAAGKPSILVPFPFAADDHQARNAEVLARAGAARLVPDRDMNAQRLYDELLTIASEPGLLERMAEAARKFARPGAAERAADALEAAAKSPLTR